jgi:hypothetical protein
MAGVLISGYWQFVPPGPHDTFGVLAASLLLLGGAAGGSRLLARRRGAAQSEATPEPRTLRGARPYRPADRHRCG